MGIQKGFAFTGNSQLFGGRKVDRAHGGNGLLQALDLRLQTGQAHLAVGQAGGQFIQIRLRVRQETVELLVAQSRGLLFELEVGDALAQGLQLVFELQAALVAGAQRGGQAVVASALGRKRLFALQFQGQCVLQAGGCGRVVQLQQLGLRRVQLLLQGGALLLGGLHGARQFGQTGLHAALGKLCFLRLPLQRAVLVTPLGELALGVQHLVIQRGVGLLGLGQLFVQGFKTGIGLAAPGRQRVQLGPHFAQIGVELGGAAAGLLGQLCGAQGFHLQRVALALGLGGLLAQALQSLRRLRVPGFSLGQCAARLGQGLGLGRYGALQRGDFLGAREQTGLLRIRRIQTHAVRRDHMAAAQIKGFARTQATALGQGLIETLGAVATTQPIGQHPPLRRVVRLHLRQQGR